MNYESELPEQNEIESVENVQDPNLPDSFKLTFRIKYETQPGQSLCIIGNVPELGEYSEFKAHMKWNEGHMWTLEQEFPSSAPYF